MADDPDDDDPEALPFDRDERASEPWLIYDSVCIGPGARDLVSTWFNTWSEFGRQVSNLSWFKAARQGVPTWASNVTGEREDFSLFFFQFGCEIWAPPTGDGLITNPLDAFFMPGEWARLITQFMQLRLKMANTDIVLEFPAAHAPGAVGVDGQRTDGAATPAVVPPSNGQLLVSNSWHFPEERAIPRQGSFEVIGEIGEPASAFFRALPATAGPGTKGVFIPNPNPAEPPTILEFPMWYILRTWFRGKRHAQIRGNYQK